MQRASRLARSYVVLLSWLPESEEAARLLQVNANRNNVTNPFHKIGIKCNSLLVGITQSRIFHRTTIQELGIQKRRETPRKSGLRLVFSLDLIDLHDGDKASSLKGDIRFQQYIPVECRMFFVYLT